MAERYSRVRTAAGVSFARIVGGRAEVLSAAPWSHGVPTGEVLSDGAYRLECPVTPSKIVCVGRNYMLHAKELGNEVPERPLFFLKPPSALIGPGDAIELPPESTRIEHEAELAFVVGERARDLDRARARRVIFGWTLAIDVTARDLQRADKTWTRGKGFDTFCPVGPELVTGLEPEALELSLEVGGTVRQRGHAHEMHFDVETILEELTRVMTLEPGDLVLTGTPAGVGPLADGDDVVVRSPQLGVLEVIVRCRPPRGAT